MYVTAKRENIDRKIVYNSRYHQYYLVSLVQLVVVGFLINYFLISLFQYLLPVIN